VIPIIDFGKVEENSTLNAEVDNQNQHLKKIKKGIKIFLSASVAGRIEVLNKDIMRMDSSQ